MILHKEYGQETDDYRDVRDQAELQETVETLVASTGGNSCVFGRPGAMVRSPGVNYVIGHGARGEVEGKGPVAFLPELTGRGLANGDTIVVIACWAGAQGGNGFAEGLAAAIRAHGYTGVTVKAPRNIIHWNGNGALLVDEYPNRDDHPGLKAALRAQTDGEDVAWDGYVRDVKALITTVLSRALGTDAEGTRKRVLAFADDRPDENKRKHIAALAARASTGDPQAGPLAEIVTRATARPAAGTGPTRLGWSAELRALHRSLHVLHAGNAGEATAQAEISTALARLRRSLAALWPAYSRDYYDAIRAMANPFDSPEAGWVTYDDAHPAGRPH
jgi:hypothetical protein